MRQRFMDSIPWTTLLVGVGVGTALAVAPRVAHADHKQSCYAGIVIVFDGAWHPGAVVGCRTVNISDSNNVVGAEVNLMVAQGTIRPRVQAVVGSTSVQALIGGGYDFASSKALVGVGATGDHWLAGVDKEIAGRWTAYGGASTLGRYHSNSRPADPAPAATPPTSNSDAPPPSGNNAPPSKPSPTPAPAPGAAPSPGPTPAPSPSPGPSPSPAPSPSPSPTPTPAPTPTPTPSPSPVPSPCGSCHDGGHHHGHHHDHDHDHGGHPGGDHDHGGDGHHGGDHDHGGDGHHGGD
ncbi:hypothetical protein, partial [Ralstonia sp.]